MVSPCARSARRPALWKHVALPLALARDRIDVFHSPTGTLPARRRPARGGHDSRPLRRHRAALVHAAHRLGNCARPSAWPRAPQRRSSPSPSARAATWSSAIGVAPRQIRVVYNGVDHARFRPRDEVDAEAVARRFGLRSPFILCVGSLMPWRNAPRLLRAPRDWAMGCCSSAATSGAPTRPRASRPKRLGLGALRRLRRRRRPAELYAAAAVFAYPSLYEGFGIPPVEAMACGTPVVASTGGALPEVLGDAALLVDPYDEDALAQALASGRGRSRRVAPTRPRARRRYTWQRAAAETWQVYRIGARRMRADLLPARRRDQRQQPPPRAAVFAVPAGRGHRAAACVDRCPSALPALDRARSWRCIGKRQRFYGLFLACRLLDVLRARGADVVVIQRDLFPFGPPLLERLLAPTQSAAGLRHRRRDLPAPGVHADTPFQRLRRFDKVAEVVAARAGSAWPPSRSPPGRGTTTRNVSIVPMAVDLAAYDRVARPPRRRVLVLVLGLGGHRRRPALSGGARAGAARVAAKHDRRRARDLGRLCQRPPARVCRSTRVPGGPKPR